MLCRFDPQQSNRSEARAVTASSARRLGTRLKKNFDAFSRSEWQVRNPFSSTGNLAD
jgi:hypothetical protein